MYSKTVTFLVLLSLNYTAIKMFKHANIVLNDSHNQRLLLDQKTGGGRRCRRVVESEMNRPYDKEESLKIFGGCNPSPLPSGLPRKTYRH